MFSFSALRPDHETIAHPFGGSPAWSLLHPFALIRMRLSRTDRALARMATAVCVSDAVVSDAGLCRDDILGHSDWDGDLPYFMQRNFGNR